MTLTQEWSSLRSSGSRCRIHGLYFRKHHYASKIMWLFSIVCFLVMFIFVFAGIFVNLTRLFLTFPHIQSYTAVYDCIWGKALLLHSNDSISHKSTLKFPVYFYLCNTPLWHIIFWHHYYNIGYLVKITLNTSSCLRPISFLFESGNIFKKNQFHGLYIGKVFKQL